MKKKHDIDVFISYSSKDQKVADNIVSTLEDYGVKCWIASRDIPQGTFWADAIDQAISRAKIFLIVVGENSISSLQVPKELGLAITSCETIIPYRIDKSELKGAFRYYLSDCQWFNGQAKNQADMENLANSVCEILGKEPVKKSAADGGESDAHRVNSESKKNKLMIAGGVAIAMLVCVVIVLMIALQSGKNKGDMPAGGLVAVSDGDVTEPEDDRDYGYTSVLLSAKKECTVYDFMFAVEVLKGRLNQYFGEGNYEMELAENNTKVALKLPSKDLTECRVWDYLCAYLVRPRELYVAPKGFSKEDISDLVKIPREEIKKVELRTGNIEEWDLTEYPDLGETYEYLELYLGENTAKAVKELSYKEDELVIVQDATMSTPRGYIFMQVLDGGERLAILDTYGNHRLNELSKYVFENETYAAVFNFQYDEAVFWDIDDFGECQVCVEELEGPVVQGIYEVDSQYETTEFSAAEFRLRLKTQLDAIGLPYAIGRVAYDENLIVLGVEASKVSKDFLSWMTKDLHYSVECGDASCSSGLKISQKQGENGRNVLYMDLNVELSSGLQSYVDQVKSNAKTSPIYCSINYQKMFVGHLDQEGNIIFDQSVYEKQSNATDFSESMKYTLDYLESQLNLEQKKPSVYTLKMPNFRHENPLDFLNPERDSYGVNPCYYDDLVAEELIGLQEMFPEVVSCEVDYISRYIAIVMMKDEMFSEDEIANVFEAIYALRLEDKYNYFANEVKVTFNTNDKSRFYLTMSCGGDGRVISSCYGEDYKAVRDKLEAIIKDKHPQIAYGKF